MISPFAIAILLVGQAMPKPATLDLVGIIRGIEKDQEIWRAQKSWVVRYTNSRERIDPPPGRYSSYGDNQIVNARKGPWAFVSEDQAASDAVDGRRTWCSWKGNCYSERSRSDVTIRDGQPGEGNLFFNVWLYPMGLCRDSLSDTFAIPEEAYREPEGLWMELPRCLKTYGGSYRVRKDLEEVDGFLCHVVEWEGKDIIWIDAAHGFNVRRRKGFQPSGDVSFEFKASRYRERTHGIWLPDLLVSITYNMDRDPKDFHGRIAYIMANRLHEARFNDVPDSLFEVPLNGAQIHDLRKAARGTRE